MGSTDSDTPASAPPCRLADLIEENIEEIARLETLDNGKPLAVARAGDITLCVKYFRHFAGCAPLSEHPSHFAAFAIVQLQTAAAMQLLSPRTSRV